jgi:cell division protein FtsQ
VVIFLIGAAWAGHDAATAALRRHPYFALNQVTITGCGPALTPADVRAWLGFTPETTLWDANPEVVRARLEAHPFISAAAVKREFPGRLDVVVHERRPQAIAVLDDLFYVDRSGRTFGPLRPRDSRDYPLITGLDPALSEGQRTWALRRTLRLLRRCDREPCVGELSEVHLEAARGMVVYPAAPRVPIVLGWGSWPAKLERAERALRAWSTAAERLASLDLRFRNQVVVTLRQLPPPPAPPPAHRSAHAKGLKA